MAAPARWSHVWVGAETGALKGVNLQKKQATNYTGGGALSRGEGVCALCWGDAAETEVLVGCLDRSVKLFSTEKGKFTETRLCPGGDGAFCGLAVHGSTLITCVESGLLKVWRDDAAENVRNDWLDLRVPVWDRDLQFLPGSDKVVTCTAHRQVRLYDPSTPQRRPVLETTFSESPLTALSLAPGATSVVVGSARGEVAVIDLRQGRVLKCLKGFAGSVRGLQCHPSLPLVASCGLDRFLRVHDLDDKQLRHKVYLKSRLNCLLLSSHQDWEAQETPAAPAEVKEEEEGDALWDSMETVPTQPPDPEAGRGKRAKKRKSSGP